MLEFFKKNHLFNSLLLLPYALILRMVVLVFPSARIPGEIYGNWFKEIIGSIQHWGVGSYLLSTFLVFIQAAIVNRLYIKQSMIGEINLFPGLCYILLTALHPSFIGLSSILVANTALMIGLGYLFDILKKDRQEETRFMVGLWFAVASLIFTPYLVLVIFGLISMSILKTLKIKDIFQYLTGFICPFVISWLVRIINNGDPKPSFLHAFDDFGIPQIASFKNVADIITISIMGLLLTVSLLGYTQIIARKNIHAQKKIDSMYALVFFCAVMALFPLTLSVHFLMILLIPFSLFLAIILRLIRYPAIAESIHFILFVTAVISQVLFVI
ncbi:MAG TPA: hypothetical protein VFF90_05530 [Saprospiraceae bacterium]|nr:hypothetical protein [Saprospiraceae bacterium]